VHKEAVEAFALWGVFDTLRNGRAKIGFREEGVTDQVLILLRGEERVFSNDVGILCT